MAVRGVETATGPRSSDAFAGLAARSGFSAWQCRLAAAAGDGRLAAIIRIAELRDRGRQGALAGLPPVPGCLTGRQALQRLALLELRWPS